MRSISVLGFAVVAIAANARVTRADSVTAQSTTTATRAASVDEPSRISLKIDPALGVPVAGPQRDAFGVGGGGLVMAAYGPTSYLDLHIIGGGYAFDPEMSGKTPGIFAVGAGARLQFPQDRNRVSPFVDLSPLYVRTGDYNRFAYSVAAGILFGVDRPGTYWLGFHVRYLQVLQGERSGFDTTDANLVMFGLSTQFGLGTKERDRDRDGVGDARDKCVLVPGPEANNGCPYLDSDGDGLNDSDDQCPMVVGPVDNKGCPLADSDKDGVLDQADKCPAIAGPAQNDGCPWPDGDGDKINDKEDACPTVPGLPQFAGCPDRDNDGVPEPPDLCPEKAGLADNDGCPRYKEVIVTTKSIELNQKIFFAFGKADILPKSYGLLADIAQAFKDYPGLKANIEGHTDSKGKLEINMRLSQARADSVRAYLIAQGVPADRITKATGYGPTQPLDDNATSEGRERNRRVEFVVETRGEAATGTK